jgi:hypothetical protein
MNLRSTWGQISKFQHLGKWATTTMLLTACGQELSQNAHLSSTNNTIHFSDWCAREELNCQFPSTTSEPIPLAYWNAAMEMAASLGQESFSFSFAPSDLNDPSIDNAIAGLGGKYYLDSLRSLAQEHGFQELKIRGNRIAIQARDNFSYQAPSKITWQVDKSSNFRIDATGIHFGGLSISDAKNPNAAIPVTTLNYTGDGLVTLEIGKDKITHVPLNFVLHDWNATSDSPPPAPSASAIIDAVIPLQDWFLGDARKIDISESFFTDASAAILRASSYHLIKPVSQMLSSVRRTMIGFPEAPIQLQFNQSKKLECTFRMPGVPAITSPFIQDIRVLGISNTAPHEILLKLDGVEGKIDIPGPIKPKMKIQEIAFETERVVIQKVPIIKEIGIRYEDIKLDDIRIDCK